MVKGEMTKSGQHPEGRFGAPKTIDILLRGTQLARHLTLFSVLLTVCKGRATGLHGGRGGQVVLRHVILMPERYVPGGGKLLVLVRIFLISDDRKLNKPGGVEKEHLLSC